MNIRAKRAWQRARRDAAARQRELLAEDDVFSSDEAMAESRAYGRREAMQTQEAKGANL